MVNAEFSVENGVGYVTVQREEALNAIDSPTKFEIIDVLGEYREDDEVKVVVFQSEGDQAFVAGGDLKEVPEHDYSLKYFTDSWEELFTTMMGKPTVAKVDGWALGGGFDLILHTDIVIAADDAMIGQPEVGLGIMNHFSPPMLPDLVGLRKTMELLLTGDPITGAEAERIGLVTRSVPREDLDDEVQSLLDSLLGHSPRITKLVKEAVYTSINMAPDAARAHLEARSLESARDDPDYMEGVRAQIENRDPVWPE
jgi:enoyl-CoA hydratase/carnithine racemase